MDTTQHDPSENMITIEFELNGERVTLETEAGESLLNVLRERLGLKGTKKGCGEGQCGACTVLLDGQPVNSCITLAWQARGRTVTTIEGLGQDGQLDPLQQSFIDHGAIQCGFCTPGMIMSAKGILLKNPVPSEPQIRSGLAGNLCRCTGYQAITDAVKAAAKTGGD
jgi:aerobic-type carbon monoxide dehydrogenase small subunit (CoxS/CutS family)